MCEKRSNIAVAGDGEKARRPEQPVLPIRDETMDYILADFDNHLMNGFDFCKKAYSIFEEIRRSPNGVERLRLRKGKLEKKLIEELLPIARYVQAR